MALDKKQTALISKYLETKGVLIVDPSGPCRSSVKKCLTTLGAKVNKIEGVENFADAKAYMEKNKPEIIFTDYRLGPESGMDLCEYFQEVQPDVQLRFFVLTTGDASESVIAEAAEEEVDCFVLKPYSVNSLLESVSLSLLKKIEPSPYKKTIEKGKEELKKEKKDVALKTFNDAKALDKKPTLACFYHGKSYETLSDFDSALASYKEALKHNDKHYKSLLGLFDIYKNKNDKKESYSIIKKLAEHFPLSSKMLANAFELAVYTLNFEDVAQLYTLFAKIENKSEDLIKRVTAGLIVCAAFLIRNQKINEAIDALNKAILASNKQDWVIIEAAFCLLRNGQAEKAEEILLQVPVEGRKSEKYKLADFYIYAQIRKPDDYVNLGRKLIKEGIKDKELALITLKGLKSLGIEDVLKTVAGEVEADFPNILIELDS